MFAVVDRGQTHVVSYRDKVREQYLVHHRHEVKVGEISRDPDLPIYDHCVNKLVIYVFNALIHSFAFNLVDQQEKTKSADRRKDELVNC